VAQLCLGDVPVRDDALPVDEHGEEHDRDSPSRELVRLVVGQVDLPEREAETSEERACLFAEAAVRGDDEDELSHARTVAHGFEGAMNVGPRAAKIRGFYGAREPPGSVTTKVAPRPGPSLSARREPPCASTIAFAIASPMPLPPVARLRAWSAR